MRIARVGDGNAIVPARVRRADGASYEQHEWSITAVFTAELEQLEDDRRALWTVLECAGRLLDVVPDSYEATLLRAACDQVPRDLFLLGLIETTA